MNGLPPNDPGLPRNPNSNPLALANRPLPYNLISDGRRFEDLVYSIIQTKITTTGFDNFDQASQMSGVADRGRDIMLYKSGVVAGTIQCKKHEKNISLNMLGEELTKFVLYALADPSLIPGNDFTYYMASSGGFTNDCIDFIDQFSRVAVEPSRVQSWIEKNSKFQKLSNLGSGTVLTEVLEVFSRIRLKKITPADLDLYFSEPACTPLIPLYFEVRTIIIDARPQLNREQLQAELKTVSATLSLVKNELDAVSGTHIVRRETQELYEWVKNTPGNQPGNRNSNICLLSANAGFGKTVVLKDLYDQLTAGAVAVLAIKADSTFATGIAELQAELGLSLAIFEFIESCKQHFPQLVLLVDQIDALSQSLSADRSYLNTLKKLIDRYTGDDNVKIIISIRSFDLEYDPVLKGFRDIKRIRLEKLSEGEVVGILAQLGMQRDQIPDKLFNLLLVPNNLNIFTTLVKEKANFASIDSLHGLYTAFWKQKITGIPAGLSVKPGKLKEVLYRIVDQMQRQQRLAVSNLYFEDYITELNYLESEGVIQSKQQRISFFHQTFFDFIFAKRFVEQGGSLMDFILENNQSFHIRSSLKMILDFLRSYDPDLFVKTIKQLLEAPELMFHIKHLLISLLSFMEQPTDQEMRVTLSAVSHSVDLKIVLFEKIRSPNWFRSLQALGSFDNFKIAAMDAQDPQPDNTDEAGLKQGYLRAMLINIISRLLIAGDEAAWAFAFEIQDSQVSYRLLFRINDWNDPRAERLLDLAFGFYQDDPSGYIQVLENIAKQNVLSSFENGQHLLFDSWVDASLTYDKKQLFRVWLETIPEQLITPLLNKLHSRISTDTDDMGDEDLIEDSELGQVDLFEDDTNGKEYLYKLLSLCLRRAAVKGAREFRDFLNGYLHSRHKAILRLVFFALKGNETVYKDDIFELFFHISGHNYLSGDYKGGTEFRDIFEKATIHFTTDQQNKVVTALKNLVIKKEIYAWGSGQRRMHSFWGKAKYLYLSRLPESWFYGNADLSRQFKELQRKFPGLKDKYRSSNTMASVVSSPLTRRAYEQMTPAQWIKSFRKYDKDHSTWKGDRALGGVLEHSRAFQAAVKENPGKELIELIGQLTGDRSINPMYAVAGLTGLAEAKVDQQVIAPLFIKLLEQGGYEDELRSMLTVARYLMGGDSVDVSIVQFLVDCAGMNKPSSIIDPEEERQTSQNGAIMRGLNSIPGAAAYALNFLQDSSHEVLVFESLATIYPLASADTRAITLWQFAHLLNINANRALELFKKLLLEEKDVYVQASALWSLQYMVGHDFAAFIPVFKQLIASKLLGEEDSEGLFNILYFSALRKRAQAPELLYSFLVAYPGIAHYASKTILKYLNDIEGTATDGLKVLSFLVRNSSEGEPLEYAFYEMDHVALADKASFLDLYIDSPAFEISESLVTYLTGQCSDYPLLAAYLFCKIWDRYNGSMNTRMYQRVNDEILKFVMTAHNGLKDNDEQSTRMRARLISIFDSLLMDFRMRDRAEKILDSSGMNPREDGE